MSGVRYFRSHLLHDQKIQGDVASSQLAHFHHAPTDHEYQLIRSTQPVDVGLIVPSSLEEVSVEPILRPVWQQIFMVER